MRDDRSFLDFLHDMLDAAQQAEQFVQGVDFAGFQANREKIFAVVRALEIIGEAATHVPRALQARYPEVPWADAGMRNKVIHEYFGVDLTVVWRTVQEDLPPLRAAVARMLEDVERR